MIIGAKKVLIETEKLVEIIELCGESSKLRIGTNHQCWNRVKCRKCFHLGDNQSKSIPVVHFQASRNQKANAQDNGKPT